MSRGFKIELGGHLEVGLSRPHRVKHELLNWAKPQIFQIFQELHKNTCNLLQVQNSA